MIFLAGSPPLKRIMVGIERTWKAAAVSGFSSVLSFTIRRSSRSAAISSSTGPTTRHGPHQGAQKSTSTGVSDSMTSAWKLVSVTSLMLPAMWLLRPGIGIASESIAGDVEREEQVRSDPGLDGGGRHEDGHGDRRRDEGRGQELVPGAAA